MCHSYKLLVSLQNTYNDWDDEEGEEPQVLELKAKEEDEETTGSEEESDDSDASSLDDSEDGDLPDIDYESLHKAARALHL